ncbi:hypothetical protein EON66_11665, partial [archaeon]
ANSAMQLWQRFQRTTPGAMSMDGMSSNATAAMMSPTGGTMFTATGGAVGGSHMHAASAPLSITAMTPLAKSKERARRLQTAFNTLHVFLRGFIEETDPDYKRVWRVRTLFQQIMNLPPDIVSESVMSTSSGAATQASRLTYIMPDKRYRFESVMFRGIEYDLLLFDMLVFCVTDYAQQSPVIAALVTYIVAKTLVFLRRWLGDRNMAYKTLVDQRFLA